jgi:hypothetical protein
MVNYTAIQSMHAWMYVLKEDVLCDVCYVLYLSINENATVGDVVETVEELDESGLACLNKQ